VGEEGGLRVTADLPFADARIEYEVVKRAVDVVIAVLGLALLAVALPVIGVAIKLESPGPVLFRQLRCGRGGVAFACWKFRTMVHDAHERLTNDADLYAEFVRDYKLLRDPRITRVGRFLRKTSLDELPQFWNVLMGEMSVVGPRPVLPDELTVMYGARAETLLHVTPGLTGLWQVSGRSNLSYEARIALDLDYVQRRSIALDIAIIARTPVALFRGSQ
jgi:lipopolysaccharide/colanic/teichoic acid biosynthesis glycosyltransferase